MLRQNLESPHTHISSALDQHFITLILFFNKLEANIHPARDGDLLHPEAKTTAARRSSRCGNTKKMWFPNTRTKTRCSSAAHSKTSRDIWIMSVWADELAAGTFVETQESVSSGLHMSAFPPLLIQTSFPRGTREEESYVQHSCDMLLSVLSLLWHIHQTKKCHNTREHRFIPGDSRVSRPRLRRHASMWLTHLLNVCGPWCHSVFLHLFP